MANPFSIFRRNQRTMLVVISVMAMLSFVFLDPLFKYLGRAGGSENPVVVKANSHSYRASELIALMQSRQTVKFFLQRLALEWVQKGVAAGQVPSQNATGIAEQVFQNWLQALMEREVPPDETPLEDDASPRTRALSQEEAAAVQTVVLAASAEEHGMLVTDQAVNDYLKMITMNMVSPAEFERIVANLRGEAGNMSQAYLFDALRRELLAARYGFMYQISLASVLPAPRWEYFQRLNRRAKAEVLGLPVERFVKDTADPSEAAAQAFFQRYAQTLPVPNSPSPGFKRPARAMFQFFHAKFSDFSDRAMGQVTSEEMHEYYEKNKDIRYRERKLPPASDADAESDDAKSSQTQPSDSKSSDASGDDKAKGAAEPQKPAPAAEGDGGKKSSRLVPASALHLVALAQKAADKKPAAAPAAAAPAAATPAAAAPAVTQPAAATGEKPAADSTENKGGASENPAPDTAAADKPSDKKEVAYEPFEKVEGEIRKILAGEKANQKIGETFQDLSAKMREFSSARGVYEANKEENENLEPPEPLDLPALASAAGVTVQETPMVSADEVQADTDLGKSFTIFLDPRSPMRYREVPFPAIGFGDHQLFKPAETEDREGDRFLSWKVKETPEGVPDFAEVRKEVVRAMKLIEARKLAVAEAEKLAKEARSAEKPLTEQFAGREGFEVIQTGEFTWMTIGSVAFDPGANQPRLSEVHGVQAPGQEFMEAVFSSTPSQIRVAMNEPKTVAYVIQVEGFEPPRDDLRQEFLLEDFRKYARLAMNDEQTLYVDWLHWLDRKAGVTWVKPGYTNRRGAD